MTTSILHFTTLRSIIQIARRDPRREQIDDDIVITHLWSVYAQQKRAPIQFVK